MITESQLEAWALAGEKINLIKEFRAVSGVGLKEAKDAVETCYINGNSISSIDPNKILRLFAPYLPYNSPINKTIAAEQKMDGVALFKQGIACAFANYRKLGYKTPYVLIQNVLDNFKA